TQTRAIKEHKRTFAVEGTEFQKTVLFGIDTLEDKIFNLENTDNRVNGKFHKMDANEIIDIAQIRAFFKTYTTPQYGSIPQVGFKANIITCLRIGANADRLQGEDIEATLINLETGDEQTVPQKTDNFGCVDLTFDSKYERYSVPRYMHYNLVFKATSPAFQGISSQREICLNPWQPNGLFGHDTRSGVCPENPIGSVPKLHFNDVSYTYIGNVDEGFKVNEHMDMALTKSFLIRLHPFIDYGHNFATENHYKQIYSGRFVLNFMLLAPRNNELELTAQNIQNWDIISGDEKEVEIVNGVIKQKIDLEIEFAKLTSALHRTYGVIMLRPVDDGPFAKLNGTIAAGLFDAQVRHFGTVLQTHIGYGQEFKSDNLANEVMMKFEEMMIKHKAPKLGTNWKVSPYEAFKSLYNGNDKYTDIQDFRLSAYNNSVKIENFKLSKKEFEDLIHGEAKLETKRKFCHQYFIRDEATDIYGRKFRHVENEHYDCGRNPDKYIDFKAMKHVLSVVSAPQKDLYGSAFSESDRLNINTGFCMSFNNSTRFSTSKRIGTDIGVGMKIPLPFDILSIGGGVKFDYSMMWGTDESTGSSNRGCVNKSKNLGVDKITLAFKAKTRSCVLVTNKPYIDHQKTWAARKKQTFYKNHHERFNVCFDQDDIEEVSESWYYINEEGHMVNPLRDRYDARENLLHKIIRGEKTFNAWNAILQDQTKQIFLVKKDKFENPMTYFDSIYNQKDETKPLMYDSALPGIIEL
ncbi:hypothetical protein, partial [Bacteriovorax sp. BSW11_IV]|uniref:hypothetical protein n=1 Tax=Bacteriovorax sp. BSW11_IV TaxID=1353529 RepID=UPI0005580F60